VTGLHNIKKPIFEMTTQIPIPSSIYYRDRAMGRSDPSADYLIDGVILAPPFDYEAERRAHWNR
jgi:hypothetical protein